MAILNFKHKGLRRLFEADDRSGIPAASAAKLGDMLAALDGAESLADLRVVPGWRLHRLTGDLRGLWSMTVTANRRLVFRMDEGDVSDVDLMDYH